MNKIQFSKGTDPAVVEVLTPFSGQLARVHRYSNAARMVALDRLTRRTPRPVVLFPRSGAQLMRIPQLGYSLEDVAFGICGGASLALLLMTVLGVN
jgi:hypothetical protein